MKINRLLSTAALCAVLAPGMTVLGQAPAQNINPNHHANLAAAQSSIVHAYQRIDMAQHSNRDRLGDHAQKAKDLLAQASRELKMAAEYANNHHK